MRSTTFEVLLPIQLLFVALIFGQDPLLSTALADGSNGRNEGETVADAAVAENFAMSEIKDVPGLPRVLLRRFHLDSWLDGGKWDVIHFNFGLWDSKPTGHHLCQNLKLF